MKIVGPPSTPKSAASQRREGEILVRLKDDQPLDSLRLGSLCEQFDAQLLRRMPLPAQRPGPQPEILQLRLDDSGRTDEVLAQLQDDPRVAYAEPNYLVHEFGRPNDLDERLWGLENRQNPGADISALQAWQLAADAATNPKPLIAVVDSGCDYNHPDLAANIWVNPGEIPNNGIDDDGNGVIDDVHGFNAAAKTGDPMDDRSHGTHVCGTVGAVGNNGIGVIGANPSAQMMPVKFLQAGYGDTADAIQGILYATEMGARITSNSWGGINYSQALYDALAASPALHICAAGNDHSNNDIAPVYPAGYQLPNLIAVAASNSQDQLASFSNYGVDNVHLAAPGDKIFSTVPNQGYDYKSGTSMATPQVSGVAGMIVQKFPDIDNAQLRDRLTFGTDRLPQFQDIVASGGRLNAARALEDDALAPATLSQMQVREATPFQVELAWQAPGDDGLVGTASAYELRYANRPIENEQDFQDATPVRCPAPKASGEAESIRFEVQPRGAERPLYVAARAVDNVGNRSPLTHLQVNVPAAKVAFAGDAEAGTAAWQSTGKWQLIDSPGRAKVWTDSPGGDYGEGENHALVSQPFDLRDFKNASLSFECRHDIEKIFDSVKLEASRDGQTWDTLAKYEGRIGWEERRYDLTGYCGDNLQIRFVLQSEMDVCKDGFYFDKLVITGE